MQLSIVIVEYHCMEHVRACLSTLEEKLQTLDWECIVLSNSEYPVEELRTVEEEVHGISRHARVVANDRNRGYAGGVNRALPECRADYVLVLNPDCRLLDDGLGKLIDLMEENPGIAAIGPKVVDSSGNIQPSCRRFPRPWTFLLVRSALSALPGASRERCRYLMEEFDHESCRDVGWLSGGAVMVRVAAVRDVGPMDERFFLYMEDVDWCKRFGDAGWRVHYAPLSRVCHDAQHDSLKGGLRRISSPHVRYHLTSMFKYFIKHGMS